MECVLFIGIPASGKSTFYKERFFHTHVRINLDLLRTRHRESIFLAAAFMGKQPFVVDNTNPTPEDRRRYIEQAAEQGFRVVGYYFIPDAEESLVRNAGRSGKARVPEIAVRSILKKLQEPQYGEGFHQLYRVTSAEGQFFVEEIPH
ncbi:AAA family ATPase [Paenibacillus gansuensis]|uniref:AAA family ATPase n=1 Tax=Paenibacillus gansuensis TaxID=306542 RepID=A0ABW5PJS2_9BACL